MNSSWTRCFPTFLPPYMSPLLARIHHGFGDGIVVSDGARPFLIGNEVWSNGEGGIFVHRGADPTLSVNIIRDHAGPHGIGVLVAADAFGNATVLPDNAFLRNGGGNIVRDPPMAGPPGAPQDAGAGEPDSAAAPADGAAADSGVRAQQSHEDAAIFAHLVDGLVDSDEDTE